MSEQDLGREVLCGETPSDTRDGFISHTAGPWTSERQDSDDGSIYYAIHGGGYEFITNVEESAANARLIAAAPDLLAACDEARATLIGEFGGFKPGSSEGDCYNQLCAAISKAMGRGR